MGPDFGTSEYKDQVERIVKGLTDVEMAPDELPQFLMMWILDPNYSRAAICEAEKILRRNKFGAT